MTVPDLAALMAEMDLETHQGRVRRMALLGRDEAGSVLLGELLDRLAELGGYWHCLALQAAVAAGDDQRLVAGLSSGSSVVRSFASSHLDVAGLDVEQILGTYQVSSTAERARLARMVSSSGRSDLVERLVVLCRSVFDDSEAARLLPACRPTFIIELLPDLDHALSGWVALGRRHPGVLLDHVDARLQAASRSRRDGIWRTMGPGVRAASSADPEGVLGLLERVGPTFGPVPVLDSRLGALVRAFPSRTVGLLLRREHVGSLRSNGVPQAVLANTSALSTGDRVALARAVRNVPQQMAALLDRLPPAERGAIFRAAYEGIDTSGVRWPHRLLEVLPAAVRTEETRRMLARREVAQDPAATLVLSSFLPIEDAREALRPALGAAQAEDRAVAYRLLVNCTRRSRSPEQLGVTLEALRRLRNEQDPVRLAAATALALTPAWLFADAHLPDLLRLVESVVEARDSSYATIGQLRWLLLRLLQQMPADAPAGRLDTILTGLDLLAGPAGTMTFQGIGLPRGTEHSLLAALLPRLLDDATRDRFDLVLSLAAGLGRRAWDLDALQDLVGRATRAPSQATVGRAVELWLAPPKSRGNRTGALVAHDPSTLTLPPVQRAVTACRQDLLDVLLRPEPLKGQFLTGGVRYVPIIRNRLDRWLPRQHEAYADALDALIGDSRSQPWTRTAALGTLARLPQIGAARLEPYLAHSDVTLIEAALGGLAWTDQPDRQLVRLLGFADGDRARVAVYAASRCARFATPPTLASALEVTLGSATAKVTSRKEAVRLLALHRAPGALERLLGLAAQDGLNRDVRIAIGRSIRTFLDDPRPWDVLDALAAASPDETTSILETAPATTAERHRGRFGRLIVRATSHPDPRTRTSAFTVLGAWAPWLPDAADIAADHVADLGSGGSWPAASRSLVAIFADGHAGAVTARLIGTLASLEEPAGTDAAQDRDRPARQRLTGLVSQLSALDAATRRHLPEDLRTCVDALASDPTLWGLEIPLMLAAADPADLRDPLLALARRLEGRISTAGWATDALAARLRRDTPLWEPEDLSDTADTLLAEGGQAATLLCVTLITAAGPRSGWSSSWRDRLRVIRHSPDPDLAAAALATFTAQE